MIAYFQHLDVRFSRRSMAMLGIVALHAVIVYAFMNGLVHDVLPARDPPPFKYVPLVDEPRFIPPPQLPLPDMPQHMHIKIPLITGQLIEELVVPKSTVGNLAEQGPGQPAVIDGPVVDPVKRVLGGPGKGFPSTADYYPPEAIRLVQQGAATVRTCVDEKGRLNGAPTIVLSSGTPSLDAGALRLAEAGSGHYRPTTEDGRSVSSCYDYRIVFHMIRR